MKLGVMSVLKTNSKDPLRIGLGHVKLRNGKKALVNLLMHDENTPDAFEICLGHCTIEKALYDSPETLLVKPFRTLLPKKVKKLLGNIDKDKEFPKIFALKKQTIMSKKIDEKFNFPMNNSVNTPVQTEIARNEIAAALDCVA